jgi:hypothetical protein
MKRFVNLNTTGLSRACLCSEYLDEAVQVSDGFQLNVIVGHFEELEGYTSILISWKIG